MSDAPPFIPGLELAERFCFEVVVPLLTTHFPALKYAAARLGPGSEVLGFDTRRSTDHDWGPQLQLFLSAADHAAYATAIADRLSTALPAEFAGYSTHFAVPPADPEFPDDPASVAEPTDGPIRHKVEVAEPVGWLISRLGVNPTRPLTTADWLTMPWQRLAEVTGGAVFVDELGPLSSARSDLAWYPDDVWRYLLAVQWRRIAQREAFAGRCVEVGDDLGARIVTAQLAHDLVRLILLLDRRYPPYDKWLGQAAAKVDGAQPIIDALTAAQRDGEWSHRERHLASALELVAERQNATGLAATLEPTVRPFHNRPFLVIGGDRFAAALRSAITDPELAAAPPVGSVDGWIDSTDALENISALPASVTAAFSPPRPALPPELTAASADLDRLLPGARLSRVGPVDAAELLVLQRCCWTSEAILNDLLDIPALHESLDEVIQACAQWSTWQVRLGPRMVGSVRGQALGSSWEVGRLMVAPDLGGRGLGRWLLQFIESIAPDDTDQFELFTGARSTRNIELYTRAGYQLVEVQPGTPGHIPGAVRLIKPRR